MKLFTLFVAVFFLLTKAYAFTLNNSVGARFTQDEVFVDVRWNCPNLTITSDEMLSLVERAVNDYWNTVPTSRLTLKKGSVTTTDPATDPFYSDPICDLGTNCSPNEDLIVDNDILIACNDSASNFKSATVLGVTLVNNITGTSIVGALFLINDDTDNYFQDMTDDERVAFLAHEIGHAIGLGHSPVIDSLMYYQTIHDRHNLGWDDIDGISYLYPVEQPFTGCGSIKQVDTSGNNLLAIMLGVIIIFIISRFKVFKIPSIF